MRDKVNMHIVSFKIVKKINFSAPPKATIRITEASYGSLFSIGTIISTNTQSVVLSPLLVILSIGFWHQDISFPLSLFDRRSFFHAVGVFARPFTLFVLLLFINEFIQRSIDRRRVSIWKEETNQIKVCCGNGIVNREIEAEREKRKERRCNLIFSQ